MGLFHSKKILIDYPGVNLQSFTLTESPHYYYLDRRSLTGLVHEITGKIGKRAISLHIQGSRVIENILQKLPDGTFQFNFNEIQRMEIDCGQLCITYTLMEKDIMVDINYFNEIPYYGKKNNSKYFQLMMPRNADFNPFLLQTDGDEQMDLDLVQGTCLLRYPRRITYKMSSGRREYEYEACQVIEEIFLTPREIYRQMKEVQPMGDYSWRPDISLVQLISKLFPKHIRILHTKNVSENEVVFYTTNSDRITVYLFFHEEEEHCCFRFSVHTHQGKKFFVEARLDDLLAFHVVVVNVAMKTIKDSPNLSYKRSLIWMREQEMIAKDSDLRPLLQEKYLGLEFKPKKFCHYMYLTAFRSHTERFQIAQAEISSLMPPPKKPERTPAPQVVVST